MDRSHKSRVSLLTVLRKDSGQGLVEYALLLVLITMVIFLMLVAFGRQLNNTYETINSGVPNAGK